jgi:hypothetical protein
MPAAAFAGIIDATSESVEIANIDLNLIFLDIFIDHPILFL